MFEPILDTYILHIHLVKQIILMVMYIILDQNVNTFNRDVLNVINELNKYFSDMKIDIHKA